MIIIIVILLVMLVTFIQYNSIVKLKVKVQQSKSGIDVYLQQRFDLIPNLVNIVKEYMNYESKTFEDIAKLRVQYKETRGIEVSQELNNQMNKILLNVENYPELKSSEQFLNLQKALSKMESQLQAARRIYNIDVTNYNTKINTVPYNIYSKLFGFKEESLFKIEE